MNAIQIESILDRLATLETEEEINLLMEEYKEISVQLFGIVIPVVFDKYKDVFIAIVKTLHNNKDMIKAAIPMATLLLKSVYEDMKPSLVSFADNTEIDTIVANHPELTEDIKALFENGNIFGKRIMGKE